MLVLCIEWLQSCSAPLPRIKRKMHQGVASRSMETLHEMLTSSDFQHLGCCIPPEEFPRPLFLLHTPQTVQAAEVNGSLGNPYDFSLHSSIPVGLLGVVPGTALDRQRASSACLVPMKYRRESQIPWTGVTDGSEPPYGV